MLHYNTVTPELKDILQQLMKISELKDFCLVGGTNLSLQLGHRESLDIDFFSCNPFEHKDIIGILKKNFIVSRLETGEFSFFAYLKHTNGKNIKVDIIATDEFIKPTIQVDNIRLASIEDIIAMKLEAISNRSAKKDYWDLAELSTKYSLTQMLEFYKQRYPYFDIEPVLAKINNFSLCENKLDPISFKGIQWHDVKFTLIDVFNDYKKQLQFSDYNNPNTLLKQSVKSADIKGIQEAMRKGADIKTLDKLDFANLPDEKKHQMTEVLHRAVAEKMAKNDLGHLKLGDSDKGFKI